MNEELTKKEIIINAVTQDPFVTIEEVAQKANTSPKYVRTTLSEKGISLHKRRKDYARKLEKLLPRSNDDKTKILTLLSNFWSTYPNHTLGKVLFLVLTIAQADNCNLKGFYKISNEDWEHYLQKAILIETTKETTG